MAKYKKETRTNLKGVKLSDRELKKIEEYAQIDDLSTASVLRSLTMQAIAAQKNLNNLAKQMARYKATKTMQQDLIKELEELLEVFEIEIQ
jgi:hypothetical protein